MMMMSPLPDSDKVLDAVQKMLGPERKPLLIAIDGIWGIGKSSLASWLAWQLGMPSIHLDLFFVDQSDLEKGWRTDDLTRAIDSRLCRRKPMPVIVEGICIRDALQKIERPHDFLIFVQSDGARGSRLSEYLARTESEKNADIRINGYKEPETSA
jgi:hypothetical protein